MDDEDYDRLSRYKWRLSHGYAITTVNYRTLSMHQLILDIPKGCRGDHINRKRLDNRKPNLRIATCSQNRANSSLRTDGSSKYKGVSLERSTGRWRVSICYNGSHEGLGYYTDEEAAAYAYDKRALELFGEFASLNFPYGGRNE